MGGAGGKGMRWCRHPAVCLEWPALPFCQPSICTTAPACHAPVPLKLLYMRVSILVRRALNVTFRSCRWASRQTGGQGGAAGEAGYGTQQGPQPRRKQGFTAHPLQSNGPYC